MGSFGVACGLSGLAIQEREETGLVLLSEIAFPDKHRPKFMLSDFDQRYDMFLPPIYGTYDDYGRLGNIKPSRTVDLLEKLFDQKIDVILECIAEGDDCYGRSSPVRSHYNKTNLFLGNKLFDQLVSYGMTEVKDDEDESIYTFKDTTLILDKRDKMWTVSRTDWRGTTYELSRMSNFGADPAQVMDFFSTHTGLYPGCDEKDYWALNQIRNLSGMFFLPEVFKKLTPTVLDDSLRKRWLEHAKTGWDESKKAYDERTDKFYTLSSNDDFDRSFNQIYSRLYDFVDLLFDVYGEDKGDMLDGYLLKQVVNSANRQLGPTALGSQHGEDHVSRKMAEIMLDILDNRYDSEEYD